MAPHTHVQELADQLARCTDDIEIMATARALAALGAEAAEATVTLESLLVSGEPPVAAAAAFVLAEIGPPALDASPALLGTLTGRLTHRRPEVRHWAAMAIGRLGERAKITALRLAERLGDDDEGVRLAAITSLSLIRPDEPKALDRLIHALGDETPTVRNAAAEALHCLAPLGVHAHSLLAQLTDTGTPEARILAACVLLKENHHVRDAMETLFTGLEHQDATVRRAAVEALGRAPNLPNPVVIALARRFMDADGLVRHEAGRALRSASIQAIPAAPLLLATLQDPDAALRLEAIDILTHMYGQCGPLQEAVQLGITNCLSDADSAVRERAMRGLRELNLAPDRQRPLIRFLESPDPAVRCFVAQAYRNAPTLDPEVREHFLEHLSRESGPIRIALCAALAHHGHDVKALIPLLLEDITSDDGETQQAALAVLGDWGGAASEAIPALKALKESAGPTSQEAIRQTITQIAPLTESERTDPL